MRRKQFIFWEQEILNFRVAETGIYILPGDIHIIIESIQPLMN
jgi:hypothetical protein